MTIKTNRRMAFVRPVLAAFLFLLAAMFQPAQAQWTTSGSDISNTNPGNVGVGTTTPTAKLDIIGTARAQSFSVGGAAAEKTFTLLWNNDVANQKVQVYWPSNTQVDGIFEITVTGHYWYSNSNGGIQKRIVINGRNVGIINMQQSEVPYRLGFTGNSNTISNIQWDAANARYYFIVSNLDNKQNAITIHVKSITPGVTAANAEVMNVTPIYTTDTTAYPQLFTSFMSGNVGVGTTTPGYRLDVQGGAVNASGGLCIAGDCKTAWSQVVGASSQWTTATPNIHFNTGNVGIGTATPAMKLHVADLIYSHRTGEVGLQMYNGGSIAEWLIRQRSSTDHNLYFSKGVSGVKTDYMMISTGGLVGIGTGAPGYKLDVQGGAVNASGGLCIAGICKTDWSQVNSQWTTSGANVHFNTGNVGIGTATPSQIFHVHGTGAWSGTRTTTAATGGTNNDGVNFGYDDAVGAMVWNREASPVVISTSNAERMRVDAAGNVGIGNANPGSKLFVGSGTSAVQPLPGINAALGGNTYISASNGVINTFIGSDTSAYGIVGTLSNHPLGLRANNVLAVTVQPSGNVGIGTTAPETKLHVLGDLKVSGNISAKYQDVAEWVPSLEATMAAGTVVILDPRHSNHVQSSNTSYDTSVAGVVSAQPGLSLGEAGVGKALIATTGRVRVKVDATRGAIRIGDLLVTSDIPGVAMRSEAVMVGGRKMHSPGTIIGKALEPLEKGSGEILVLLSLQ
jgi:hypothetical protein